MVKKWGESICAVFIAPTDFPQWTSAPCVSQDDSTNSTISGQSSPLTLPPVINEPQSQKVLAENRTGFSSRSSLL